MVILLAFIKWSVVISYTSSLIPLFRFCIAWVTVSIDMRWQSLDSQHLLLHLVATKLFTLFTTSLKYSSGTLLYNWSYIDRNLFAIAWSVYSPSTTFEVILSLPLRLLMVFQKSENERKLNCCAVLFKIILFSSFWTCLIAQ